MMAYITLVIFSFQFPFFWDNVLQASAVAHFYYDTHFSSFLLPEKMDAGHPPFWGLAVALLWKILGKSLWVGHALILPFACGIVWQTYRIVNWAIEPKWRPLTMIVLLSDPTLLAQITQVSPDVALLFFFLWAVASIIKREHMPLALAALGITLFSLRGSVLCFELFLIFLLYRMGNKQMHLKALLLPFVPALLFVSAYYGYHFLARGWIRYHEDSSWETQYTMVNLMQLIKNAAVITWRILDFGRLFIWAVLLGVLIKFGAKRLWQDYKFRTLLMVYLCCFPLLLFLLFSSEFILHRYLMNIFLLSALLFCFIFFHTNAIKDVIKYWIAIVLIVGLWTGNLWVYPKKISTGWDSTLAHIPYYSLYSEMLQSIDYEFKIPVDQIGSAFPNDAPIEIQRFGNDYRVFPEKKLETQKHILYCNVYNDFSDDELNYLIQSWTPIKTLHKGSVWLILYKK